MNPLTKGTMQNYEQKWTINMTIGILSVGYLGRPIDIKSASLKKPLHNHLTSQGDHAANNERVEHATRNQNFVFYSRNIDYISSTTRSGYSHPKWRCNVD
jgi:hypothetical protein